MKSTYVTRLNLFFLCFLDGFRFFKEPAGIVYHAFKAFSRGCTGPPTPGGARGAMPLPPFTFLLGNYFFSYECFHFNLRNTKIETKGEKYINATIVSKAHSLSLSFYNAVIHKMMFQNHSAR